jgi:hypothetical protein
MCAPSTTQMAFNGHEMCGSELYDGLKLATQIKGSALIFLFPGWGRSVKKKILNYHQQFARQIFP